MAARQLSGREVTDALSAELPKLAPGVRSVCSVCSPIVTAAVCRRQCSMPPRVATSNCESPRSALLADWAMRQACRRCSKSPPILIRIWPKRPLSLATVPGENVDSELVANISKADGKALAALIQAVGMKRLDATPELMKALSNSDTSIRYSALAALGETIKPKDLHVLIAQYVNGKNADDTAVAGKACRPPAFAWPIERPALPSWPPRCPAHRRPPISVLSKSSLPWAVLKHWKRSVPPPRERCETPGHGHQGTRQMDDGRRRTGAPRFGGRKIL